MDEIQLLKHSLIKYKEKWERLKNNIENTEDVSELYMKYNYMIYVAQWITESIENGISVPHDSNICNILLLEDQNIK